MPEVAPYLQLTEDGIKTALVEARADIFTAAQMLGVSLRASNGYATNRPIPETVAILLRLIVELELTPDDVR